MKKIAIFTLLSAFAAAPALADNTGKFYMAGDLGSSSYSNAKGTDGTTSFPNPGMFRIAGGYHFSPTWAAEVGYPTFGDSVIDYGAAGKDTVKVSSVQVAAIGSLPLSAQFDLTGKIGLASNSTKYSTTVAGFVGGDESKADLLIGLGAEYHVSSQFSLRAQYDSFGKVTKGASPVKASAFTIGVAYNF